MRSAIDARSPRAVVEYSRGLGQHVSVVATRVTGQSVKPVVAEGRRVRVSYYRQPNQGFMSGEMSTIKRLLCAWGLSFICIAPAVLAGEQVILYGDAAYRPYSFVEDGKFQGMYIDILSIAAERLKPDYDVLLVPVPWRRGLLYLQRGTGLALFPPGLKKERGYIQTYSVPLYRETEVVFCTGPNSRYAPHAFPADFKGLKMGINNGFLLSERLTQAINSGVIRVEEAREEANLRKLARGRIDCYVSDRGAALHLAKELRAKEPGFTLQLQEVAELSEENTYIGYSAKANPAFKQDFIRKMDAVLSEMQRSGEIDAIVSDYFR